MLNTILMIVSLVMPNGQEVEQERFNTTMESCVNVQRRYNYIESQRRIPSEMNRPFVKIHCNVQ